MNGWTTARMCGNTGCVEVRRHRGMVAIRSSTHPSVVVYCTPAEWRSFAEALRLGDFNDLHDTDPEEM